MAEASPLSGSALVWFRRDLRDYDHAALSSALQNSRRVYCVFVFDTDILSRLPEKADRRVEFIWESVCELQSSLRERGGDLLIVYGSAAEEIPALAVKLGVCAVFCNRDYEPEAVARDARVAEALSKDNIAFRQYKDQVIFEREEILTQSGKPYGVYTPYRNAWMRKLETVSFQPYPTEMTTGELATHPLPHTCPTLEQLGFTRTNLADLKVRPGMSGGSQLALDFQDRIDNYADARNFPAVKGVSYLSVHLRFGTVSVRQLVRMALERGGRGAESWLGELIWRDFYFQLLHHYPQLAEGRTFKPEFDEISWPNDPVLFQSWCLGKTGFPLVDAAMRQLLESGYMHNRLRMVTASFLVKDLLVDWRMGEKWFAEKLLDFDLAANNGGWQWAASTGCDAQPWFRIFNPVTQSQKFDPKGKFIRRYVPELDACEEDEIHAPWKIPVERRARLGLKYPSPVVDHAIQRMRVLALYKKYTKSRED